MIIQIIEDDYNKSKQISKFVSECLPDAKIIQSRSYQSGMELIVKNAPDLIILDMSLPTYDSSPSEPGWTFRHYGGKNILRAIKRKKILADVIIVTMYERFGEGEDALSLEELKSQLEADYSDNYIGTVFYQPATLSWKDKLKELIDESVGRE